MSECSDWLPIRFGELVEGFRGVSYQPHDLLESPEENSVVLLRANNIQKGSLEFESIQIVPKRLVKAVQLLSVGDIAVCMSNGSKHLVGKSAQFVGEHSVDFTVGAFCSVFRVKQGADPSFIKQLFLSNFYQAYIDFSLAGSAINNLKNSDIESMIFNVPPKDKQKKIAQILQTIDQTIEKTEALIEKYQQIKAGLMHDLFTRGIGADGQLRPPREQAPELYQQTPIGWIPKEWGYDDFGQKILVIDPNPSHRYPVEVSDGIPICSTENFHGEDGFIFKKLKLVSDATYINQNNRCQFSENDVIFARKGKIGLARRYGKDKKIFSHTVVVMKPVDRKTDSRWLLWLTRSDWLLKAIDVTMNTNSGVPTLGVEFIKNIAVPFPGKNEQINIAEKLDVLSHKIQIENGNRDKLQKQKSGLMHDLLTGKVSVQINEPNTEASA